MGSKEVQSRIEEVTNRIWNHNQCNQGGTVDLEFFRAFVADIYETAMLDALTILENTPNGKEGITAIEGITGYTLKGK